VVIQPPGEELREDQMTEAYVGEGVLVHSGPFNGQQNLAALESIASYLDSMDWGTRP